MSWAGYASGDGGAYHIAMLLYFLCIPRMNFSIVYPLLFKTKIIGVNLLVTIVDNSWTVSCLKENLNMQYTPYIG